MPTLPLFQRPTFLLAARKLRGLVENPTDDENGTHRWRLFWTQQHGDNATYEVTITPR